MDDHLTALVIRATAEVLQIPETDVKLSSDIVDDLGGSSLELLEIVNQIEEEVDANIPDEMVAEMPTVESIITAFRRQTANASDQADA